MLVACGCSFTAGDGLHEREKTAYPVLVGNQFGMKTLNLSRVSASNNCISAQIEYAASLNPLLVIIGTTTVDRMDWVISGKNLNREPTIKDYAYHSFLGDGAWHPFKDDPEYNPIILSDSFNSMFTCMTEWKHLDPGERHYFMRRLHTERERFPIIRDYFVELYNHHMKARHDRASIMLGIRVLERNKIPYVVIDSLLELGSYLDENLIIRNPSFFDLSRDYPDELGTLHFGERGHEILADVIIDRISEVHQCYSS